MKVGATKESVPVLEVSVPWKAKFERKGSTRAACVPSKGKIFS